MLTIKILNSPSKGTMRILQRKVCDDQIKEMLQDEKVRAIGLVQGSVADVIMAADVAAVNEAINAIRMWEKDDTKK